MRRTINLPAARTKEIQNRQPVNIEASSINCGRPVCQTDQSGGVLEIYCLDYIDPWGFDVAQVIPEISQAKNVDEIVVKINSPGGFAFDGVTLYNELVSHPASVRVEILGLAASAASVIAMAGDEILMGKGAEMMIHMPWSLFIGNADELEKYIADMRVMENDFIEMYADRSKFDADEIEKMLRDETYLNAAEAIKAGLADGRIVSDEQKEMKAATRDDISINARFARMMKISRKSPETDEEKSYDDLLRQRAAIKLRAEKLLPAE